MPTDDEAEQLAEMARTDARLLAVRARESFLAGQGPKDYLIGHRARDDRGRRRQPNAPSVQMPCHRCGHAVWVDRAHRQAWPKAKAVCVACATGAPNEGEGLRRMQGWLGIGDPRGAG